MARPTDQDREGLPDNGPDPPPYVNGHDPEPPREWAVSLDDFHAYMPNHCYICAPTGDMWPASSVNSQLRPVPVLNPDGSPKTEEKGRGEKKQSVPVAVRPSDWLDRHKPVQQMTWAPGEPQIIRNRLIVVGGWKHHAAAAVFNLYHPPPLTRGDPGQAQRWLDHVAEVYPDDAGHIIKWLAQRVQRPQDKINHAIVMGGKQGIGKDTILEPVKRAIGQWNFHEASPTQLLGRFNGFIKSVILRLSEARDLGEFDRFAFYEHCKSYLAAPPDVLRVDEKHIREYYVPNILSVIITTNNKTNGIYLPADDRRHYVAWSDLDKDDFAPAYFDDLWKWFNAGGAEHVAAYLRGLDLSGWNEKTPPPKTQAFWDIVQASHAPESGPLQDALEKLGSPAVITTRELANVAAQEFSDWLRDRRNSRQIPHRLEEAGYVVVRNPQNKTGLWKLDGARTTLYAKSDMSIHDRVSAAMSMCGLNF